LHSLALLGVLCYVRKWLLIRYVDIEVFGLPKVLADSSKKHAPKKKSSSICHYLGVNVILLSVKKSLIRRTSNWHYFDPRCSVIFTHTYQIDTQRFFFGWGYNSPSVRMNAEISETIRARVLGLSMQIFELPGQHKFISAWCKKGL